MKHIITMTVLLCLQVAAFAQITPSVYVGVGAFTNLGGGIGIGTEVQYKSFSANVAIGASYFGGRANTNYVGDNHYLGYDIGLKCYFYKGLFGGVNYGLLFKNHIREAQNIIRVENRNGFTFSLGYKWPILKRFYCMAYIGITSDKDANRFFNLVMPRYGFIFGHNIISNK